MAEAFRTVELIRIERDQREARRDATAVESPLEVRLNGDPFAVIMRTPGSDPELVAGFLLSEGVISAEDVAGREREFIREAPAGTSAIEVLLPGYQPGVARARRVVTNSSCGVCGRVTLEAVDVRATTVRGQWTVDSALVVQLPLCLRRAQAVFDETGGLHAAGLFDRSGRLEDIAEDVGRHNAVDKVVGRRLLERRLPIDDGILFVSGRTSFEIVQKAALAGVPIVGAVSAPSSLAIDLANSAGITLLGFVRDGAFNVYTHERRIV